MTQIPLHSTWLGRRNGEPTSFKVVGIWGTGSGPNYRPLAYELQPENDSDPVVEVSREDIVALINESRLTYL